MRHDAEQGVYRKLRAAFEPHQRQRQQQRDGNHRIERIDVQQQAEGHAEQRGVRQGIAEVRHPAPDHE